MERQKFIWYSKKGKPITIYPTSTGAVLSEEKVAENMQRIWAYFKTLDIRFNGKLAEMEEKLKAKGKSPAELWDKEKIFMVRLTENTSDMSMTIGESILLTASDVKDFEQAGKWVDEIALKIPSEVNDVDEANYTWKVFPLMTRGDETFNRIVLFQAIKKFCTENKLRFQNSSVPFMNITVTEWVEMKKAHRLFRDYLQVIVWNYRMGDNMVVPKYDDPNKYDNRKETPETKPTSAGELEMLARLSKDLKDTCIYLSDEEARYLVDTYYQMQEYRKAAVNQARILDTVPENEPHELLNLVGNNFLKIEKNIKSCLEVYAASKPIGKWMMSICGIGPVITAGLLANIDISKVNTAGAIQRFAGLDPTVKWEKGQIRPFNARLKVLCWKIGESFVKVSNKDEDYYGKIYRERKEYEEQNNEQFLYAEQAKEIAATKNFTNQEVKAVYASGKLPPGHINSRAKRYAVKIFISHLFEVWYELYNGKLPPAPYAIGILGHKDKMEAPNWYR